MELQEQRRSSVLLVAGAIVLLAVVAGVYLLAYRSRTADFGPAPHLPMGPTEQTYAARIHFHDLKMSRASNFLNQEVTYLTGVISNDGPRTLRDVEITVEYRDSLNRVILRETMRPLGLHPVSLPGEQQRQFQLAFEHIPAGWNVQFPTIRVTGLLFQ